MNRRTALGLAPVALLALASCGEDSSPTDSSSTSTTTATPSVAATVSPSPATAQASSDSSYDWSGSFSVTLAESAGVAANIRSLSVDLQQSAGGIVIVPPTGLDESYRFNVVSSGNRLAASGSSTVSFEFFYTLPNGGREALVTITFNLTDDNAATYQTTAQVSIV